MPFNWNSNWDEQSSAPDTPGTGQRKIYPKSGGWYSVDDADNEYKLLSGEDTSGSSTDNAIARWNGTSGDTIQNSVITINDGGYITMNAAGYFQMLDTTLSRPELLDFAYTVNAIGAIGGGAQDIDLESGNVVTATVDTSETTFTFSNPPASGSYGEFTLILTNGGSQTVNWPGSVVWAGGSGPSLTASGVDVLKFLTVDAGTTWYGQAIGLDFS